ncbi:MAG TPA: hypothetical protein P5181_08360 [Dermatophilaceae bacterium]|nr:hypothetical protein [Dermatophilaceae bacterium]
MYQKGLGRFKFYVGISSLDQVATREDRVCVLNILGGESRDVTPVSHEYSGGNVVFGTSPGRGGRTLETALGGIPVYDTVADGMADGHRFNAGVVYLPPAAARHGVGELIRVNPDLEKIFIVTEKIPAHDAREIRAMGQLNGIDIFGANSLGVADSWHHVRIGGALGGNTPSEALRKGSIAILSNSGNFTTTIATYLRMGGWGTTTLISSGKDVYIHYAAPEFAYALANDARTKAAVLYVEPGGYYELDADFTKPIVACVVGRWKSRLTRAVGHAGAMGGSGDDAAAKERWLMDKLEVADIYTPEHPVHSQWGAVVTNIAHIPEALTAVMAKHGVQPDFAPEGSLELKPWFGSNRGLALPPELDLPVTVAMPPYDEQIRALDEQIGAVPPRQSMKDASAASFMDPATQVSHLRGTSILTAASHSMEANIVLALLGRKATAIDEALVNVAVGARLCLHGTPHLAAASAARAAGNTPNVVAAAAVALCGPATTHAARSATAGMIDLFAHRGLTDPCDAAYDCSAVTPSDELRALVTTAEPDPLAEAMLHGLVARGVDPVFVRWLRGLDGHPSATGVTAATALTLAWQPLLDKQISRTTAQELPWWMELFATIVGAAAPEALHEPGRFAAYDISELLDRASLTELAATALLGHRPDEATIADFRMLSGLLLTNGPGSITAQGAKGAVSADGPQTPERVLLNKAMMGFLTHAGYSHGGNGFEGIAFLLKRFHGVELEDPGDPMHGLDLTAMARRYAAEYGEVKVRSKAAGALKADTIPCINHPVFKGKPVNVDPREEYVRETMERQGRYNVFHDYYRHLVVALHDEGVTKNVFAVNVDALIATLLLRMLWPAYRSGEVGEAQLSNAAFTAFLFGRMIGCAAEVDDHLNRARTWTPGRPSRHSPW